MTGRVLGHYRIMEQIGAGGMGVVYRARDERLERDVAVKVLAQGLLTDETARKRFRKEALALSRINHPNIATVFDFHTDQDTDYLVMEYIPGETLASMLAAGPLPEKEALKLAAQMAEGLAAAHEQGVMHRDLKPGNLRVTPEERLKILDFGLATVVQPVAEDKRTASITETPATAGTVAYMAPEQLRDNLADARSDVYSTGAVLYEMLAGRALYPELHGTRLIAAILDEPPPQPPASPAFQQVIAKALDKEPSRRYQTVQELLMDLERITTHGALPRRTPGSGWYKLLLAAALLLVTPAGLWLWRRNSHHPIESIAVLPLANLSGDASQDYFADGMTEALITGLVKVKALHVPPRTSVMPYRGTNKTVAQIAGELKVDAVLEGTVTRSGNRVRITADLVEAATERHLWAESYEREITDILSLQGEVAQAIAREIQVQVTPQEQRHLSQKRSVSPEAYDAFLRGQFHILRENERDNADAIRFLERAVSLDPAFTPAVAALGRAYGVRVFYFNPEDRDSAEKGLVAVEKALALDPNVADALLARGMLLWTPANHFPHEQAIQAFRHALQLNPDLDEAHHQLGVIYMHIGLLDKAAEAYGKAVALNPGNTWARNRVGVVDLYAGKYQEALDYFLKTPSEFNPSLWAYHSSFATFQLGRIREAETLLADQLKKDPRDRGGLLHGTQALVYAATGRSREALSAIHQAELGRGFGHFHHTAYMIALAYSRLRQADAAMRFLEQAAADGYPCYPAFADDPNLNPIRHDRRFITFMDQQKEQWERWRKTL